MSLTFVVLRGSYRADAGHGVMQETQAASDDVGGDITQSLIMGVRVGA